MWRQVGWTAWANFTIQGLSALTAIGVARILEVEGRGQLATAMMWPTLLAGFALLGTESLLARLVARHPGHLKLLFRSAIRVAAASSALATIISLMIVQWHVGSHAIWIAAMVASLGILGSVLTQMMFSLSLGLQRIDLFNTIRVSFYVIYGIFVGIIGVSNTATVANVAGAWSVAALLSAAGAYWLVTGRIQIQGPAKPTLKIAYTSSTALAVLQFFQALIFAAPVFLLSSFGTSELVGAYVVAWAVASLPYGIAGALGKVAFSMLVKRQAPRSSKSALGQAYIGIGVFALLGLAMYFAGPSLVSILFGRSYVAAETLSQALAPVIVAGGVAHIYEEILKAKGQFRAIATCGAFVTLLIYVLGAILLNAGYSVTTFIALHLSTLVLQAMALWIVAGRSK